MVFFPSTLPRHPTTPQAPPPCLPRPARRRPSSPARRPCHPRLVHAGHCPELPRAIKPPPRPPLSTHHHHFSPLPPRRNQRSSRSSTRAAQPPRRDAAVVRLRRRHHHPGVAQATLPRPQAAPEPLAASRCLPWPSLSLLALSPSGCGRWPWAVDLQINGPGSFPLRFENWRIC